MHILLAMVQNCTAVSRKSDTSLLARMPGELLLMIASMLPHSARISLRLTTWAMYHGVPSSLPEQSNTSPKCENNALQRFLAERKDLQGGRRRCIVCYTLQELRCFREHEPICTAHDGWLRPTAQENPIVGTPQVQDQTNRALRIPRGRYPETYCAHKGIVSTTSRESCECQCDSCVHIMIDRYTQDSHPHRS